ncbi:hypothetical protein LY28_00866 [Ruminiclostridium sufflavum DSM 19573]|uniref:Uncharacterized protein n=1 Tax=Ruminiclostridium sufflavum DSM 19573 TaxID=1121337 RepID=A0A318XPR5_9FIRM|nr:hypothetical protein LY28_00866 [Ruminiclostridium sufflavum DSM 19573]
MTKKVLVDLQILQNLHEIPSRILPKAIPAENYHKYLSYEKILLLIAY